MSVRDTDKVKRALSNHRSLSVTATGIVIKASPGTIYEFHVSNINAITIRYLKIYNKATAPTETDTPIRTIALPTGGVPVLFNYSDHGLEFTAGISIRCVNEQADSGTTGATANEVIFHCTYD